MRKLGILILAIGLTLIGFTLIQDPETRSKFTKNLGSLGVEAKKLYPAAEVLFTNPDYINLIVYVIGYTLMSSFLLVLKPLKFLAFFHLLALAALISVLAVTLKSGKDDPMIIMIAKSVGVAGGLLYYLGC